MRIASIRENIIADFYEAGRMSKEVYERTKNALSSRLGALIQKTAGGTNLTFAKKCAAIGGRDAPGESSIRSYLEGTLPRLEKVVIMALAGGVTVDWLTGVTDEGGPGGEIMPLNRAELQRRLGPPGGVPGSTRSVEEGKPPDEAIVLPGLVLKTLGEELLVIDLKITGREDRLDIPFDPMPKKPTA